MSFKDKMKAANGLNFGDVRSPDFPSGVLVGKIMHVYNSSDGLSYRLKIELSTDFGNLRDVCIIDNSLIQERIELFHAAQDSIKPKEE